MTENTFFEPVDDDPAQSRRSLLVLGAVGGALALAAGGYFLLGGGGGAGASELVAQPTSRTPVVAMEPTAAEKLVVLPAVSKVRLGRDPFLALYIPPVASLAAPATGSGTTPTGTTGTGTTGASTAPGAAPAPTVPVAPLPVTPTGRPAPSPARPPAGVKHVFSVFGITGSAATGRARVSIDGGAPFTVHEGSVFGPSKELTVTDIGPTVGVGEHLAFTLGEDPQPEMYAHESRLVL